MRLLTIADAAVELNVPESWLRKAVTARRVPFTRLGRHVRFTDSHLAAIVTTGEHAVVEVTNDSGLSHRRHRRATCQSGVQ